jgi:hypothetical protein
MQAHATCQSPPICLGIRIFHSPPVKRHALLEIELWGHLVSLVSQVPSDYSNLYRQLDTTSSNFYNLEDATLLLERSSPVTPTYLQTSYPSDEVHCVTPHTRSGSFQIRLDPYMLELGHVSKYDRMYPCKRPTDVQHIHHAWTWVQSRSHFARDWGSDWI